MQTVKVVAVAGKGFMLHAFGGACIKGRDVVVAAACSRCFCCSFSFCGGGWPMQRRAKGVPWRVSGSGTAPSANCAGLPRPRPDYSGLVCLCLWLQRVRRRSRLWCWESCAAMYPDWPLAFSVSCQQPVRWGAPGAL